VLLSERGDTRARCCLNPDCPGARRRGKIHIDRFELIDPRVQLSGDLAVLTFRFDSHGSEGALRWNTTEVYQKGPAGWKIIHIHWAFHQPKIAA
jgi:ketosteroid isomerase-like protein